AIHRYGHSLPTRRSSDLGLATFSGSSGVASEQATGSGLVYGGALGMRVLYFTLGARFRMASMGDLSPWSLLGEGALRIPLGKLRSEEHTSELQSRENLVC